MANSPLTLPTNCLNNGVLSSQEELCHCKVGKLGITGQFLKLVWICKNWEHLLPLQHCFDIPPGCQCKTLSAVTQTIPALVPFSPVWLLLQMLQQSLVFWIYITHEFSSSRHSNDTEMHIWKSIKKFNLALVPGNRRCLYSCALRCSLRQYILFISPGLAQISCISYPYSSSCWLADFKLT